jgi:hypothetical protein
MTTRRPRTHLCNGSLPNPDEPGASVSRPPPGRGAESCMWRLTPDAPWRSKRVGEPVAQLVEHETFNLGAVGSNPTGLTKFATGQCRTPAGIRRPLGDVGRGHRPVRGPVYGCMFNPAALAGDVTSKVGGSCRRTASQRTAGTDSIQTRTGPADPIRRRISRPGGLATHSRRKWTNLHKPPPARVACPNTPC